MAPRAAEVWGLEIVERGGRRRDRQRQAERDRQRALLRRRRAAGAARAGRARRAAPTCSCVDPPRAGLSQKVVRRIIEAAPRADRLRLLQPDDAGARTPRSSSRPATRCERVRPVDMFPQTPHIECVALLERAIGFAPPCAPSRSATASCVSRSTPTPSPGAARCWSASGPPA